MRRLYQSPDDFEAVVRILTQREGGRRIPPRNGIRWDLRYFHQGEDELSMVYPEFIDESGEMIPADRPITGLVRARFYVQVEAMRGFHWRNAAPGIEFFCVEEAKVCAAGIITRITGLSEDSTRSWK